MINSTTGCSVAFRNLYPKPVTEDCVEHWPYIADSFGLLASVSVAAIFQGNMKGTNNLKEQVSVPIFILSSAFLVSTYSGISNMLLCRGSNND